MIQIAAIRSIKAPFRIVKGGISLHAHEQMNEENVIYIHIQHKSKIVSFPKKGGTGDHHVKQNKLDSIKMYCTFSLRSKM